MCRFNFEAKLRISAHFFRFSVVFFFKAYFSSRRISSAYFFGTISPRCFSEVFLRGVFSGCFFEVFFRGVSPGCFFGVFLRGVSSGCFFGAVFYSFLFELGRFVDWHVSVVFLLALMESNFFPISPNIFFCKFSWDRLKRFYLGID